MGSSSSAGEGLRGIRMRSVWTAFVLVAATVAVFAAAPADATVTAVSYSFQGHAFYQFGDPADKCSDCASAGPDTGWVTVTNNGTSTFDGSIGFNAVSPCGIDFTAS